MSFVFLPRKKMNITTGNSFTNYYLEHKQNSYDYQLNRIFLH